MKNTLLLLIIFYFPITSFAGPKQCFQDCEEYSKMCEPAIKDIESKNRFLSCGGKPFKGKIGPKDESKYSEQCKSSFVKFLNLVLSEEKKGNTCKVDDDCIMSLAGTIPYHVNKSSEPDLGYILSREFNKLSKVCPSGIDDYLDAWIQTKDSSYPSNYSCIKKMCVPNYSGKSINWTRVRFKIQEEKDPDFKKFHSLLGI